MEAALGKKVRVAKKGEPVGKLGPTRKSADRVLCFLMSEDGGRLEVEDAIYLSSWELRGVAKGGDDSESEDEYDASYEEPDPQGTFFAAEPDFLIGTATPCRGSGGEVDKEEGARKPTGGEVVEVVDLQASISAKASEGQGAPEPPAKDEGAQDLQAMAKA